MSLLDLLRGPRLYTRFRATLRDTNPIETVADNMFSFARGFWNFMTGFSPVVLAYLYSRGALTPQSFIPYANYVIVYAVVAFSARLIGRLMDLEYRSFVVCWSKARETGRPEDVFALKEYDFEIAGGPIDFVAVSRPDAWYVVPPDEELSANFLVKALSYFCVTSFGRRIMYPGSVSLLNYIMSGPINENRKLMVTAKGGQRVWMKSATDDTIDAMFVDMRKENVRGHTLVISCEGNAGFYEVGIANTPIQLGYSVLGWNHPGFAESTGIPMPANVFAAADAVMQYALGPLNFKPENIVLFGWSIGGFPASWLAANYPQVRALILDATFDDVLPLAIARMPSFAGPIVQHAVRAHLNLQIDKHVNHFDGPIRLIRRMQEEIIITDEMGTDEERRASNRANNLLKSLLVHRHPDIVKGLEPQIDRWLSMSPEQRIVAGGGRLSSGDGARVQRLFSLCDHYFVDFDSNHVTPLSPLYFNIPSPVLGR